MSILKRTRKEKNTKGQPEESLQKEALQEDFSKDEESAEEKKEPNRYFFVVEEIVPQGGEDEPVTLIGNVHGTICLNDVSYLTTLNKEVHLVVVNGIEEIDEGQTSKVTETSDCRVAIELTENVQGLTKYAVLTNVRPQLDVDVNRAIENPEVAALLFERNRMKEDPRFFNWLFSQVVHGYYITPVKMSQKPRDNGDGTATYSKDTEIAFRLLESSSDQDTTVLPVFTDWTEMLRWFSLVESESNIQTMILRFPDCVAITQGPESDGFVVNPFSDNSCYFTKGLIESITKSPGYQAEFADLKKLRKS